MSWIKKYLPGGGGDSSTPFIIGSDKWMSSTAQHKGEKASSSVYQPPVEEKEETNEDGAKPEIARSKSFAPPAQAASELPRSASMSSPAKEGHPSMYPQVQQYTQESGQRGNQGSSDSKQSSGLYPKIYEGKSEEDFAKDENSEKDVDDGPLDPREECLVTIPDAIVHLIDEQQSPHLATGHLSIVRIAQKGNGIVVLVRVGENLHWPLMKDEPTVKLDPTHYFFSLPVPSYIDESGSGNYEGHSEKNDLETLNYGVTFPDAKKHEKELQQLDDMLALYSSFSSPTLIQGDQQKEEFTQKTKDLSLTEKQKGTVTSDREIVAPANLDNNHGGKVVPTEVLSSDGKQVVATEENQAAFWTTMAPNVDDYGSSAARAIATGSGHIIRGIFWVRDSTVKQLEGGTIYLTTKLSPGDKPSNISPTTLKNLKRVRKMSRATENVAKSVLLGVVKTAGFFSGSVIKSRAGKKIFKLMPGEVALVSLDAFGKLFDAVERATTDVLQSTSLMTQNVVGHKYGEAAAQVTQETLATAGHVVATAWTVSKLRKAFNPKDGVSGVSKTGMVKGLAKNVLKGK
ncbi:hypothetical protein M758_10G101000 [Ceratodon purpureus]|nr:hypothetical protein M758_10G101000 [Ceratodon purpureus]